MQTNLIVTLGPRSLNGETIRALDAENVSLLRINLSHTNTDDLIHLIDLIKANTSIPICLDSEGAQLRCTSMDSGEVSYQAGQSVLIPHESIIGNDHQIAFTPEGISRTFEVGDQLQVDFDGASFQVDEITPEHCKATVIQGGRVGSHKAAQSNRMLTLPGMTNKDREAIKIGREQGITHYALSFASSGSLVDDMRALVGESATIISKIESLPGLVQLKEIMTASDAILIDRGDLSTQTGIERVPFLQRRIIAEANQHPVPVYVATNLMESMRYGRYPTRAEVNDVVSTLMMGADGLVLAAETAVGAYPVETVRMVRGLIERWRHYSPEQTVSELLSDENHPFDPEPHRLP